MKLLLKKCKKLGVRYDQRLMMSLNQMGYNAYAGLTEFLKTKENLLNVVDAQVYNTLNV